MLARRREGSGADITVSTAEMEAMEEEAAEIGITPAMLMQEAGYQVAGLARRLCGPGDRVVIYAGAGNNGGDGLVAARRLDGWGFDVTVVLASRELDDLPAEQLSILERLDVELRDDPVRHAAVVVDALLGTGLEGAPREPYDTLIEAVNDASGETVTVDVPSGVEADAGELFDPHVEADRTVMLGAAKRGLDGENAGELWTADIGLPAVVYERRGLEPKLFGDTSLLRLPDR